MTLIHYLKLRACWSSPFLLHSTKKLPSSWIETFSQPKKPYIYNDSFSSKNTFKELRYNTMLLVLLEVLRVSSTSLPNPIASASACPSLAHTCSPHSPLYRRHLAWQFQCSSCVEFELLNSSCGIHGEYTIERYVGYVMKGDKRGVFSKTLTMKLLELTWTFAQQKCRGFNQLLHGGLESPSLKKLSQSSLPPCPLSPRNHGESLFRMYPNVRV